MGAMQYQGLFFLTLGVLIFTLLLFGLRALASSKEEGQGGETKDPSEWRQKEELEIIEIISETHDIKTFRLKRASGQSFPEYSPGQFLSFQIGDDPKLMRSYSVSASPTNRSLLQVSIKRLSDGKGSSWFHERKVGDRIWVYPPSGHFTDVKLKDEPRVYIAGGVGITPILSMVLANLERAVACDMTLFYGMRSTQDMAFHEFLQYLSQRHHNLKYVPVLSSDEESWKGERGYITYDLIQRQAPHLERAHYFFCGPAVMTDKIVDQLLNNQVSEEQIHTEKFASPVEFDPEKIPHREAKITFRGQVYQYKGKQTLLEFLESQGVDIPYACRTGVCGSCKCEVRGQVDAITDDGLSAAEKRRGLVLPCVAFPLGDLDIEDAS